MKIIKNILYICITFLAFSAFLLDTFFQHLFPGLWLYIPAMGLAMLPPAREATLKVALLCTGLIFFGTLLAFPTTDVWLTIASRAVVMYGIWVTAGYSYKARLSNRKHLKTMLGLGELANSAPTLLWVSSSDRNRIRFNNTWIKFTGRSLEREIGTGWTEGIHHEDLQNCLLILHTSFRSRQSYQMEYRLRNKSGEYHWIHEQGCPRYQGGKFVGYYGSCTDITELKRNEESLKQAIENAEEMRVETETLIRELQASIKQNNAVAELAMVPPATVPLDTPPQICSGEDTQESIEDDTKADVSEPDEVSPPPQQAEMPAGASESWLFSEIAEDLAGNDGFITENENPAVDSSTSEPAPVTESAASTDTNTSATPKKEAPNILPRILIAESDPEDREHLSSILDGFNMEVNTVTDGEEAIQKAWSAEREGNPYHMILMDMQLPGLDGFEATRLLRQGGYSFPIIALNKSFDPADDEKCLLVGCVDTISKPYTEEDLDMSLRKWTSDVLQLS